MQNIVNPSIPREIFKEVVRHLDQPEITLITGSRQVGKTVLLEQLRSYLLHQKHIPPEAIFSYNLDILQDEETIQNQQAFIEFLKTRSRERKIYVFVDEAQKVPEAARFFKGVYDAKPNAKLILTGSSSLEIKARFKETLAGRKRIFSLSPFTFFEYMITRDTFLAKAVQKGEELSEIDMKSLLSCLKEYLVFGGYPRVVLAKDPLEKQQILREIYSSYVERDVVGFLEIKYKTAFTRLVKLLASQIGQLVNIQELAMNVGVDRYTVERYLQALEETFIVKRITPYFKNPRQEIVKAGKIYFLDSGIRNMALSDFTPFGERLDKGPLLENGVFSELLFLWRSQKETIHFWRTKQKTEVDFVLEQGPSLLPVEVKSIIKDTRISPGLANFREKFNPRCGLVVNLSLSGKSITSNHTKIYFLYPFELRRFTRET